MPFLLYIILYIPIAVQLHGHPLTDRLQKVQSTNLSVDVFSKGSHSRCQVTATARFLPRNSIALISKLQELNPFLDDDGMVQVGGRLQNSLLPYDAKHPVILGKSHVAWLLKS